MIKRFLLPLSVAALMMSGTITYAGEISQPAEAAETAVAAGTEFETEEAGTEEIVGTNSSFSYTVNNNEITITGLAGDQNVDELDIPAEINGMPVKCIGENAFRKNTNIKSVTLPEGLEVIGVQAFTNCTNLGGKVVIPSTVTVIKHSKMADGAFEGTAIQEIEFKDSDVALEIQEWSFHGCNQLEKVTFPSRLELIGYSSFEDCSKLKEVQFAPGNNSLEIGFSAFCATAVEKIVFPSNARKIERTTFANCKDLKEVIFNEGLESIGSSAFYNCTSLEGNIVIPSTVQTIEGGSDSIYTDGAFENTAIKRLTIKEGTENLSIGQNVFRNCKNLSSIELSNRPLKIEENSFTDIADKVWVIMNGKKYWYENGVLQGYDASNPDYRGKEIYDPDSDAWYWLDNVQGGAVAVSKDVYQESYAGEYADREDGTGKWVRYDANGHMVKGFDKAKNGTYYFDPVYGAMVKGFQTIDGKLYYFDPVTGIMQTGAININGVEYAFDTDGTALDKQWYTIEGKKYWYENGVRQGYDPDNASYRGKEIYDSKSDAWYWLDNVQGGAMAAGKDVYQESDGGKWVRYNSAGKMIKGWDWNRIYSGYNYFDKITGAMYKGWHNIDGKDYYFDENTGITTMR